MSINPSVLELEMKGDLFRFVARSAKPSKRCLFMSKVMKAALDNPNNGVNLLTGRGQIEGAFARWTLGDLVYDNGHGKAGFLKRLEAPPPEVWEIRVTNPNVQARVLGRFVEPNCLLVTDMYTRNHLGRKGSAAWKKACQDTVDQWDAILPGARPFSGTHAWDYITENCDEFAI